ncbi:hypothetical protein EWM64_g1516 [Hericium alpestre]|uniref:Uncharacterized protein n=1 Tax=Hericium alpestre TaxID=135208 RepID=A0A4Z0A655_9AGAM|nr:hypothetical protein EWM64_g1516 [Hericium alpestre]
MGYIQAYDPAIENAFHSKQGSALQFFLESPWLLGIPRPFDREANGLIAYMGDVALSNFPPKGNNTRNDGYKPEFTLPPSPLKVWNKTPAQVFSNEMWNELQTKMIWSNDRIHIAPHHLFNEAGVQSQMCGRLLPTYNNTMSVFRGDQYLSLNSGGAAHSLSERYIPDLAMVEYVGDTNRVPSDFKFSIKWRAVWANFDPNDADTQQNVKEWRAVIAQVHAYMTAYRVRVGFVMSDIEMQVIFREGAFWDKDTGEMNQDHFSVEVSPSIPVKEWMNGIPGSLEEMNDWKYWTPALMIYWLANQTDYPPFLDDEGGNGGNGGGNLGPPGFLPPVIEAADEDGADDDDRADDEPADRDSETQPLRSSARSQTRGAGTSGGRQGTTRPARDTSQGELGRTRSKTRAAAAASSGGLGEGASPDAPEAQSGGRTTRSQSRAGSQSRAPSQTRAAAASGDALGQSNPAGPRNQTAAASRSRPKLDLNKDLNKDPKPDPKPKRR